MRRALIPLLLAAACSGEAPDAHDPVAGESAAAAAADPALQQVADEAEAEARAASMEGTEGCLQKAAQLPPESRARIEAACRRLPSGRE